MSYIFCTFKSILLFLLLIPSFAQAKSSKSQGRPLIILLHGLGNDASAFEPMKQALEHRYPEASVVTPKSVEGMESINLAIKEQSEKVFKELCSNVENLKDRPIILVGHSQGGLRAYAFFKQYKNILNIRGLVTLATPWEGVAGARVDATMLSHHLTAPVLNDLRALSPKLFCSEKKLEKRLKDDLENELEKQLILNVQSNQAVCLCPGGKDLMQGSAFLVEVKKWLPKEKVPILAIGGGGGDFSALQTERGDGSSGFQAKGGGGNDSNALQTKKEASSFKVLNDMYAFFVVGDQCMSPRHDMQVSLDSQHALHIVPKRKKNFTRLLIEDAVHSTYVLTIPVPKSKVILAHPCVLDAVIKFAKNKFK